MPRWLIPSWGVIIFFVLLAGAFGYFIWSIPARDVSPNPGKLQQVINQIDPNGNWHCQILREAHAGGRDPADYWELSGDVQSIRDRLPALFTKTNGRFNHDLKSVWHGLVPHPNWWPALPGEGASFSADGFFIAVDLDSSSGNIYVAKASED